MVILPPPPPVITQITLVGTLSVAVCREMFRMQVENRPDFKTKHAAPLTYRAL
jgi:hypothetical protein